PPVPEIRAVAGLRDARRRLAHADVPLRNFLSLPGGAERDRLAQLLHRYLGALQGVGRAPLDPAVLAHPGAVPDAPPDRGAAGRSGGFEPGLNTSRSMVSR